MRDETKCLHSGYKPENGGPGVMPIVRVQHIDLILLLRLRHFLICRRHICIQDFPIRQQSVWREKACRP